MIMKTITMMPETKRREIIERFKKLVDDGRSISDISHELNIPESEIHEGIEWARSVS